MFTSAFSLLPFNIQDWGGISVETSRCAKRVKIRHSSHREMNLLVQCVADSCLSLDSDPTQSIWQFFFCPGALRMNGLCGPQPNFMWAVPWFHSGHKRGRKKVTERTGKDGEKRLRPHKHVGLTYCAVWNVALKEASFGPIRAEKLLL